MFRLIENFKTHPIVIEDTFKEIQPEACKPVLVSDEKCMD